MRNIPAGILTQLNKREGLVIRTLYWIVAKNRNTGANEELGIWNGEDTQQFVVDGKARAYVGGGGFLNIGTLKHEMNLNIQPLTITANPISPEFIDTMRLYDPKGARVEVHIVVFDPETNQQIDAPFRVYKGWLNTAPIKTGAKNEKSTLQLNHVGHSRILTRLLPAKRSDDNQRRRLASDSFLRAVVTSGTVETPWGTKGVSQSPFASLAGSYADYLRNK